MVANAKIQVLPGASGCEFTGLAHVGANERYWKKADPNYSDIQSQILYG